MNAVLSIVWSLPFIIGMVVGIVGQRLYCRAKARWEDKHHPLPDGRHHVPPPINRVWIGGLIAAGCVAYVLSQAEQTHDDTVALSERTSQCQADLIASIDRGRDISAQNDALSIEQRDLLAKSLDAGSEWVQRLLVLPPELADLDRTDPRVTQYGLDVTRAYYDRIGRYRARINEISDEQNKLAEERAQNNLPSPRCG